MEKLRIYCDCGSYNNGHKESDKPMIGSYGSVIVNEDNKIILEYSDFHEEITNNQGELFGFIRAYYEFLRHYKSDKKYEIEVISDSQYLIHGINSYLDGWKKRNWKNSSGQPVKNLEMWKIIDKLLQLKKDKIKLKFTWQKGHCGKSVSLEEDPNVYFNEYCDSLATSKIDYYFSEDNCTICPDNEFDNLIEKISKNLKIK